MELAKKSNKFCYLDTSGNWRTSTLDRKPANKVGLDEFYKFYSMISDLMENLAMLLYVDMIQLYFPLEFATEIYRACIYFCLNFEIRAEKPSISVSTENCVPNFIQFCPNLLSETQSLSKIKHKKRKISK